MKNKVGILSVGEYLPDYIMTNKEFESKIETTDEWIQTRTGIKERRIASPEMKTSDMAVHAALAALEKSSVQPEMLDFIIVATATPDNAFPSVACSVQDRIGAKKAFAFDVSAACSGFIYALVTALQFVESGRHRFGLVIGAEKYSSILDWNDRNTSVLFGDAAGAVLVGPVSSDRGILSYVLGSDGSGGSHLYVDNVLHMNGREIYKFAVRKMGDSALQAIEQAGLSKEDIDYLIPHQANVRIIDSIRERLNLDPDKVSVTVDKYGNTSAASIILSLHNELEQGRIHEDDTLVFVGFGGGLTWGAIVLKWGK